MRRESEFRYLKLAGSLREQILSGYIKPGDFLMSENELGKFYGLSRTSVRKALDELSKEKLIVKKTGQGSMVSPNLEVEKSARKRLHVLAPFPSNFVDYGLSLMTDVFQRDYPHVDVKVLSLPTLNFWEAVSVSTEMGLHPDLVMVSDREFAVMDNLSSFVNLNNTLAPHLNTMYPRVLSAFCDEDAIKAAPFTFSTVYLAYNPAIFKQYDVPEPQGDWSLDPFMDAAKKLTLDTNGDGIVDLYGIALSSSFTRWPVFALQNGVKFSQPIIFHRSIYKTFSLLHDLLYRDKVATLYQTTQYRRNSDAFIRGKAAMVLTTALEMAGWRHQSNSVEAKVAALPFGEKRSTLLVANAFMVPKTCQDVDLASAFIATAFREDVQESMSRQSRFLSTSKSVNRKVWDQSFLASLNIKDNTMDDSYFLHEIFADLSLIEELEKEMELFWTGLESASGFTHTLQDLMTKRNLDLQTSN